MRHPALSILAVALLLGVLFSSVPAAAAVPDARTMQAAADYSRSKNGLSVLVMQNGRIVFEQYHNGARPGQAHALASGTKSFSGALAVAAVEDGLLDLDEAVSATLPEWSDPQKAAITVRDLLTLSSGVDGGPIARVPTYQAAVDTASPRYGIGEEFQYGPVPFQVFGELLRRKLAGEDVLDYLKRRILTPIGLAVGAWRRGVDGNPNLPSGAALTAREWVKLGELVRNRGRAGNRQILRADLLAQCFTGTEVNPAYGLTFWLNAPGGQIGGGLLERAATGTGGSIYGGAPRDLVMAAGAGQQRLYIIPSLKLVVVRQGRMSGYTDAGFLSRLFGRRPEA